MPEEPILMTLIRQAEQRKPFVPVPSALNVLATGGDARGALAAVSVKSPTETGASLRPSSPNQRVVPADAAETRPHNIDLLPVSGSGAAVDANSSLFLAKLATPQKQQTLATAKNEQSPSFATPPDQQLNSEKKASNLPPLSFMPKPTASPLTSIAAAPPLGGTTMLTSAQLEHSSSIEDVIEDIDVDIPEDLVMDDDDLVNAVSGGFGTSVSLANTTPPRFASPDEEDAAIGDIPLAGLDDDDVSFGHASTSKHANADAWL